MNEHQGADAPLGHRHHWLHGRSPNTMLLFDPDHARPPEEPACRPSLPLGWILVSGVGESHLWREISQRRLCALRVTPRQWRYKTYGR